EQSDQGQAQRRAPVRMGAAFTRIRWDGGREGSRAVHERGHDRVEIARIVGRRRRRVLHHRQGRRPALSVGRLAATTCGPSLLATTIKNCTGALIALRRRPDGSLSVAWPLLEQRVARKAEN